MVNPNTYDPMQKPGPHHDIETFDDPIRNAGLDVTTNFDDLESGPAEWAGSEVSDLMDIQVYLEDEEDEADEEDLDVDDEDLEEDEEPLVNANGNRKNH